MYKKPRPESGLGDFSYTPDIQKNVLPKFIKLCLEGHKYGRRKPTETSVFEFSSQCVNSLLEELKD